MAKALSDDEMLAQMQSQTKPLSDDEMQAKISQAGTQDIPKLTQGDAAAIGAGQGITFGLRPFIKGVGGAIGEGAASLTAPNQGNGQGFALSRALDKAKQGFSQGRQEANQEQTQAANEYPKTYYGSMLGGGLLTAPLTPIKTAGQAVKLGAGLGAANALSSADSVKGAAVDVASGAATGGILHGAASAVTKGIAALPNASQGIKDLANKIAFKALGPYQRDVLVNQSKLGQIGETAMREGVVGSGTTSYEGLADRANKALDKTGIKFESMLNDISDAASKLAKGSTPNVPMVPGSNINPSAGVSKSAIGDFLGSELKASGKLPGDKLQNKQVNKYVTEFLGANPDLIDIKDAQSLKTEIGKRINWNRDPRADVPQSEKMDRALYHALNKGVEDAADAAAPLLGDDALNRWQQVKQDYGALKTASVLANRRAGRDFANRFISPSDYFTGMEGAMHVEGPALEKGVVGAALGMLNHYARTRGNQVLAPTLQKVGNAAAKVQPLLNAGGLLGRGGSALQPTIEPALQRGLIGGGQ